MANQVAEQNLIYLQIAQMIQDDILREIYKAEEQVPSSNELAKALSVNPATANKGLNLLVDQGILFKKRGLGMFVAENGLEIIREKRKEGFAEKFLQPLLAECKVLGITREVLIGLLGKEGDDAHE